MRVLHVIQSIGPLEGGPSAVIRTMARCQAESGMEVHIATTDGNGRGRLPPDKSNPTIKENVTYWIFPRQTRFYSFSFPLTVWLCKHLSKYDIVHIHGLFSYTCLAAAVCARISRTPYFVRPFGILSRWGMCNGHWRLKRIYFRLVESRMLKGAAGVQYTSEQEAQEAQLLCFEHKRVVVPNPVELIEMEGASASFGRAYPELVGKTVLLFLSRLDPKKGLDLLLPAFARIRSRHPDAVLIIAGEGEPAFVARLKQSCHEQGLDAGVRWAGFVQGEEKRTVLAGADLFILPSYSENFGVAVVEALGAGLPVLISDQVGVHREVAAANAGLVVECEVDQIESALVRMLEDPTLRARMSSNAVDLAKQFSPEVVSRQLARELYGMLTSEGPIVKRGAATSSLH